MMRYIVALAAVFVSMGLCFGAPVTDEVVKVNHVNVARLGSMIWNVAPYVDMRDLLGKVVIRCLLPENALEIRAEPERIARVKKLIAALDVPRRQVRLNVRVVRTREAARLLGVPVSSELTIEGRDYPVPRGALTWESPASPMLGGGGSAMPGSGPGDRGVALCNREFDPKALAALLAESKAWQPQEMTIVTQDGAECYGGSNLDVTGPAGFGGNQYPPEAAAVSYERISLLPMIRDDGTILIVAGFGPRSLTVAWVAEPGKPVALGQVPWWPGEEAVVFIVSARVVD